MPPPSLRFPLIIALAAPLTCAAIQSPCPPNVSVQQAAAPVPGWSTSYRKTSNTLSMVTFFSGPPAGEASLVYDEWIDTKGESIATWRFPKDPAGYWIQCSYSDTTLELAHELPESVSSCRVTYERAAKTAVGLPVIKRIACS